MSIVKKLIEAQREGRREGLQRKIGSFDRARDQGATPGQAAQCARGFDRRRRGHLLRDAREGLQPNGTKQGRRTGRGAEKARAFQARETAKVSKLRNLSRAARRRLQREANK